MTYTQKESWCHRSVQGLLEEMLKIQRKGRTLWASLDRGVLAGKVRHLTILYTCVHTTCLSSLPVYTVLGVSSMSRLGILYKDPKDLGRWLLSPQRRVSGNKSAVAKFEVWDIEIISLPGVLRTASRLMCVMAALTTCCSLSVMSLAKSFFENSSMRGHFWYISEIKFLLLSHPDAGLKINAGSKIRVCGSSVRQKWCSHDLTTHVAGL